MRPRLLLHIILLIATAPFIPLRSIAGTPPWKEHAEPRSLRITVASARRLVLDWAFDWDARAYGPPAAAGSALGFRARLSTDREYREESLIWFVETASLRHTNATVDLPPSSESIWHRKIYAQVQIYSSKEQGGGKWSAASTRYLIASDCAQFSDVDLKEAMLEAEEDIGLEEAEAEDSLDFTVDRGTSSMRFHKILDNRDANPLQWRCIPLPEGAYFSANSSIREIVPISGFHRVDWAPDIDPFSACPYPIHCVGVGHEKWQWPSTLPPPATNNTIANTSIKTTAVAAASGAHCLRGSTGLLCAVCEPNFNREGGLCRECSDSAMYVRIGLGFCALMLPGFIIATLWEKVRNLYAKYGATAKDVTRVMKILVAYMQIKLSFPKVMIVRFPQEWLEFLRYFNFFDLDILDVIGTTCLTRLDYQTRFAGLCLLPLIVAGCTYGQYRLSLKRASWKKMVDKERWMYLREAAESLFDSANLDDDARLCPAEMRVLMRQMLGKKLLKQADIMAQLRIDSGGSSDIGDGGGSSKNKGQHQGVSARVKSFFGQEITKAESLFDKRVAREANKKHRVLQQHELHKAELLVKQLGGERNVETGQFELSKSQFVDAFENGDLEWHGGLTHGFKDRVIRLQSRQRTLIFASTLLLFLHLPVSVRIFQYFWCRSIHQRMFLRAAYEIECFVSRSWLSFSALVLVILVFYTFAYPAAIVYVLMIKHRNNLQQARVRQAWGFLYDRFRHGSEFWEVAEMSRKLLLTCTVLWLPPALGPSVALSISILACCCLNYFRPHRNPIVFAVANASYIFTALAFVSATILVHFHESESPRTRFFIGMYLILLDISLIFFALLAIMYSFLALKKKIKEVRKRRRRTKQIRLHHHGIIKLEDDGAGGLLMPLRDDDGGGKNDGDDKNPTTKISPVSSEKDEGDKIIDAYEKDEEEFRKHQTWEARKHRRRLEKRLAARLLLHRSEALQQCPLFAKMEQSHTRTVLEKMHFFMYKKGDVIIKQGDVARQFFIIAKGSVGVSHEGHEVAVLEKFDFFGESALKAPSALAKLARVQSADDRQRAASSAASSSIAKSGPPVRNATVTALEDTHVCALTRAQLVELIKQKDLPASVVDNALDLGKRRSSKLMRKLSRRVTVVADLEHDGKLWQSHHHGESHVKPKEEEIIHIKTWSRQLAGSAGGGAGSSGSTTSTTAGAKEGGGSSRRSFSVSSSSSTPTTTTPAGVKEGAGEGKNGDLTLEDLP